MKLLKYLHKNALDILVTDIFGKQFFENNLNLWTKLRPMMYFKQLGTSSSHFVFKLVEVTSTIFLIIQFFL